MVIGNTKRVEEYDVAAGEVRLHVRDVGEAHAEPVLFLHGIMGHRRDWDVLVDRVGGPYRVLAVDQRGHGRSEWARSYGVSDMAADAIAVIEHLGVAPVSVVGHSMGAMVALVVAARRPELVDRIVLIDVVPESLTTDLGRQLPAMLEAMAASSYATVDDAVAEWQAGNPLARADLLRNYVTHALVPGPDGRFRWRFDASGLRSFSSGVSPQELWAAVDGVSCTDTSTTAPCAQLGYALAQLPEPLRPEELEKAIRELPRDRETIDLFNKLSGPDPLPPP